ncbi:MAG: hypothetical protein ACP5O5_01685 [Fervidicoccaceae archaeon]
MNRDKLLELKKFLEEEIKKRKKEVEYLEFILAYIEGTIGKETTDMGKGKEENIMEVKSGKDTVAFIVRTPTGIKAKLLFETKKSPELLSEIKRQISIIDESSRVSFSEDKDILREIVIESKSLSPVIESGIVEALKLILIDTFKEEIRKKGKESYSSEI